MLEIFSNIKSLPYADLKAIYAQSLQDSARQDYRDRDDAQLQAEHDFYEYLRTVFFRTEGAVLCLWYENSRPVSVLRLEPYRDGMLLAGLETDPAHRGKGYASKLVAASLENVCIHQKVYAHIDRKNPASIRVHEKCGFEILTNYSVFLDGSVSSKADTYVRNS